MSLFLTFTLFFCAVLIPGLPEVPTSFSVSVGTNPIVGVSPDFLAYLIDSFNGIKGASVIGSAAVIIQVIIKALQQPFSDKFFKNKSGLSKLLIISGLTLIVTPLGLVTAAGLPLGAAMVHSTTLLAFMVFLNQLYQQATREKKVERLNGGSVHSIPTSDEKTESKGEKNVEGF